MWSERAILTCGKLELNVKYVRSFVHKLIKEICVFPVLFAQIVNDYCLVVLGSVAPPPRVCRKPGSWLQ